MGWYDAYKPTNVSRVNVANISSNSGNAVKGLGNAFTSIGDSMLKVDKARDDEKTNKFINAYRDAQTGLTKEKTKTVVPESEANIAQADAQTGLIGAQTKHKNLENSYLPEKQKLDKKGREANIKKTNADTGYVVEKSKGQVIANKEEPINNIVDNNLKKAKTQKVKKETSEVTKPKPISIPNQRSYLKQVNGLYYHQNLNGETIPNTMPEDTTGMTTEQKAKIEAETKAESDFVKGKVNEYMNNPNSDGNIYNAIQSSQELWKNSHKTTEKPKLNPKEDSVLDGLFKKHNL